MAGDGDRRPAGLSAECCRPWVLLLALIISPSCQSPCGKVGDSCGLSVCCEGLVCSEPHSLFSACRVPPTKSGNFRGKVHEEYICPDAGVVTLDHCTAWTIKQDFDGVNASAETNECLLLIDMEVRGKITGNELDLLPMPNTPRPQCILKWDIGSERIAVLDVDGGSFLYDLDGGVHMSIGDDVSINQEACRGAAGGDLSLSGDADAGCF